MHRNTPIAYAFCRIEQDNIIYALLGHDPTFGRFSPGTLLLMLIIERLFAERRFRAFDFGGMAAEYKAFFATSHIDYVKVIWLPTSARHLSLVTAHLLVRQAWRGASWLKRAAVFAARGPSAVFSRYLPLRLTICDPVSEKGALTTARKASEQVQSEPARR
jgi:hypothetical protein